MATSPRPIVPDPVAARPVQLDQVDHLLKLQKWAQKISSILDLDELIHKIVDDVATSFCCVETNIYLHDQERGELEMAGVHGCTVHGKGSRLKVGTEGMVGYVAATRQMRYAPDVRQDPYYIACEAVDALRGGHSLIGGWSAGGRVCGVASRPGRLHPRASALVAEFVRSRCRRCAQRAALPA